MEYKKQDFTNGQVLTADNLNHIEDGVSKGQNLVEITYLDLEIKKAASELVEGQLYRIIEPEEIWIKEDGQFVRVEVNYIYQALSSSTLSTKKTVIDKEGKEYDCLFDSNGNEIFVRRQAISQEEIHSMCSEIFGMEFEYTPEVPPTDEPEMPDMYYSYYAEWGIGEFEEVDEEIVESEGDIIE